MKLEHSFEVEAPLERVWETLIDVERIAPCLPGAQITGSSDGVYEGNFTVKLGPTTAAYAGKLEMTETDEAAHVATMNASGRDKRGQGSAKATIVSSMSESGNSTKVEVVTDFTLTGRLARFGRGGMIEDVSHRLVGDFVNCLRGTIEHTPAAADPPAGKAGEAAAPPPPVAAESIRGGRLFFSILWERIKRLFGGGRSR